MRTLIIFLFCVFLYSGVTAQVSAKLFRHPDVSKDKIAFSYGGDIWVVSKNGGTASRLSSAKGNEITPRFSPDGSQIALTGNYDGNTDIYVIPTKGGIPTRITHHGMSDQILDWFPDGKNLIYVSSMKSGKQRFSQFYKISAEGGLPEKLPMAYGEMASISADGKTVAFTDRSRARRTWKRYRGGSAADIWIFDMETLASENITNHAANDESPMWINNNIYYISDKGPNDRFNIWVYDVNTKQNKQITNFTDFDIHYPANGPDDIIFEAGGKLYLLDLATHDYKEVKIDVVTDMITLKTRKESVTDYMQSLVISPDGNRAVIEARGEIFSLPAEKGYVQNLTRTSGVAERSPAWSPNGRYIAYWSDKTGEYELTIRDLKEGAKEKTLTTLGPGFRYYLYWSPDSKYISFVDQTMTIWVYNKKTNTMNKVGQDTNLFEGGLQNWKCSWSSDSQWMAYTKNMENGHNAIFFYNPVTKQNKQITSGFYSDSNPTFDPKGDYLYLTTDRSFTPIYSDFDNSWSYPNATGLAAITLRKDVASPVAVENDTVAIQLDKDLADAKDKEEDKDKDADKKDDEKEDEKIKIDFDGMERRLVMLAPKAGNMGSLSAVEGKVIFHRFPNSGTRGEKNSLKYYDLKEKEEKTIIEGINGYELSANGKKILVVKGESVAIIDVAADQKMDKKLAVDEMVMTVEPRKEWTQIFNDAWRFERDYFYDKNMHGVDWDAMRKQYGDMIQDALTRSDVNFILGELIGELNASHTYRGGGDQESAKRKRVGYLGVDWAKENGEFKIKTILRGADWDNEVRSPLDQPGVDVNEGDYIMAVNGIALNESSDPWAAFEGLSGKTVELTVNNKPSWEGSKVVVIKTLSTETRLRNLAWIESNRKRVDEASNGRIGYIYVPSTGVGGQNELVRQFYGQWNKEGLIIDERFNNGGQIPDRFIELLNRKPLAYWAVRDGKNWQWPPVGHFGSMAMLINGWAGSGGDAFPDYFKKAGLGPLIGARTWGGLIGVSGAPSLIDGGRVTVPTFRMYNPDGTWFKEGHGVDPDIKVLEDPTKLAQGIDTQLEKAISEVLKSMQAKGAIHPKEPAKEDRSKVIKP